MTGVFLPLEILKDENLTLQEKIILSMAKNMPEGLYMTNSSLGSLLGVSKGRVSHIISSLKSKGYVDVTLIYNESKQVDKRIVTIKKAIEKVHEIITKCTQNKNKQLKQVVSKVSEKVQKFNTMCSHKWDFDQIEQLEELKIRLNLGQITLQEYKKLIEPIAGTWIGGD